MTTTTSHSSPRKNAPRICLFIKEGFVLNDPGRIVRRKRKWGGSKGDLSSGFVLMCSVEVEARSSQSRPHQTYELIVPLEWIGRIVTLKKPRGKNPKESATKKHKKHKNQQKAFCPLCFFVAERISPLISI